MKADFLYIDISCLESRLCVVIDMTSLSRLLIGVDHIVQRECSTYMLFHNIHIQMYEALCYQTI